MTSGEMWNVYSYGGRYISTTGDIRTASAYAEQGYTVERVGDRAVVR
jgi:hypothetical protein